MPNFFYWLGQYPETLMWFVIGSFVLGILLVLIISSKLGWLPKVIINRDGIHFEAKTKKQEEKEFESGRINKILDDKINAHDIDLFEFALEQTNKLERALRIKMRDVQCQSTRQSLMTCIRPLWRAARKNNFKLTLRPEQIKEYMDALLKEIIVYYQELSIEKDISYCSINDNIKCQDLPELNIIIEMLQEEIIDNWALPIRKEVVSTCQNKIKDYKEQIPLYEDLKDTARLRVANYCIKKNEDYIHNLTRPLLVGEI